MFKLLKKSNKSDARLGVLSTAHGKVSTPFFMPIATKAAVKSMTAGEVKDLGAEILLSNTYHNFLRPGMEVIKKQGGLHEFMQTDLPILTDSGGYQVFSLSNLRKIKGDDVEFRSHLDGSKQILNPKKVIDIQVTLGSDVMMVLDECVGLPSKREVAELALERTTRWAKQAIDYKNKLNKKSAKVSKQLVFGIVQGADFKDLRLRSAKELTDLNFDGYAVGGLAVGEPAKTMYKVLDYTVPALPDDKARYLMGVGYPENIIESVKRGIDMFDCVIPTREARHGKLYVRKKTGFGKGFYETLIITNAKFKNSKKIFADGRFGKYTYAYVHHLFKTQETLGTRLATMNNLEFYLTLMKDIRVAIKNNKF
ncbi:tRNA guanosine(34) transglycosylase Tgt [Candidatus Parcubacteria bacterium]|jgi:queuine tRNA-ribosyltransferase|nr:tRNA guanosine(34) transglycosylase Tgt [Candidatus Parcubacteria bacterium]MBT7228474.1 tRNA guanosine(34) transglycosylase Tgt [Candidatus Parcubacteria bacterium]